MAPSFVRQKCDCQAQRHELLEIAPNCLNCGKIICVKEGLGPCTFCNTPLLSNEEYAAIIGELKQERGQLKSEINNSQQSSRPKSRPPKASYSGSAGGQPLVSHSPSSSELRSSERIALPGLDKANAQLANLLNFQSTSAQRTRIIDNAADFDLPSSSSSAAWLTPVERAAQIKRQQRSLRKMQALERKRNGRGKRVVSIDLRGNKLVVGDHSETDYSSEDDDEEVDQAEAIKKQTGFIAKKWDPDADNDRFVKPLYHSPASTNGRKSKQNLLTPDTVVEYLHTTQMPRVLDDDGDDDDK